MKFRGMVPALALLVFGAVAGNNANALILPLDAGTITTPGSYTFNAIIARPGAVKTFGPVLNHLDFNLGDVSNLSLDIFAVLSGTTFTNITLQALNGPGPGDNTPVVPVSSTPDFLQLSFSDLASGAYRFLFSGTVSGATGGFSGTIAAVPAVPEPETWLMMLIGAGLVAYQLRRKQQVIQHAHSLSAA